MNFDLKDWFSYEGTIEKREFILRVLLCIGASILTFWIPVLGQVLALALMVVSVFASIRRLKGMGKSPWLTLVLFIPLIGLIFLIWMMVAD